MARCRQPALGVARGGGLEVGRAEVAVAVDERVAQREVLGHAHQRVVDRAVAVGVVLAHHVAGDPGALHVRPVGAGPTSYMPQRIRRCTGFRPSRTSGSAR